jgi:hypothetical protein
MRIVLTDRFIAGAKSDGAQAEFFDAKTKGASPLLECVADCAPEADRLSTNPPALSRHCSTGR